MPKLFKYILDFVVLALLYFLWLCPKWKRSGKRELAVKAVYLDVSDEEITLWDSASAGQIIAVAKYAQAMPGAADALQDCDFTDLDEDGNSDLTANFSFADGTTANLAWFYADGGFVYNEEFSTLPGDTSARGVE